jgi:NhaP-type Na+/H+ or K+/H+ antiporter
MAHYTWYNLSPQGKTISSITISIFGSAAESFVFAYIGLCTFTYTRFEQGADAHEEDKYPWSLTFIVVMCIIIIVGRIVAVWSAHGLVTACSKTPDVTFKELLFITYGGMIRGAIAFGLVLKIPDVAVGEPNHFNERGVVVTTTLACVIFTTVVFGSFMPII